MGISVRRGRVIPVADLGLMNDTQPAWKLYHRYVNMLGILERHAVKAFDKEIRDMGVIEMYFKRAMPKEDRRIFEELVRLAPKRWKRQSSIQTFLSFKVDHATSYSLEVLDQDLPDYVTARASMLLSAEMYLPSDVRETVVRRFIETSPIRNLMMQFHNANLWSENTLGSKGSIRKMIPGMDILAGDAHESSAGLHSPFYKDLENALEYTNINIRSFVGFPL